jgi:hypothetical protein
MGASARSRRATRPPRAGQSVGSVRAPTPCRRSGAIRRRTLDACVVPTSLRACALPEVVIQPCDRERRDQGGAVCASNGRNQEVCALHAPRYSGLRASDGAWQVNGALLGQAQHLRDPRPAEALPAGQAGPGGQGTRPEQRPPDQRPAGEGRPVGAGCRPVGEWIGGGGNDASRQEGRLWCSRIGSQRGATCRSPNSQGA